MKKDQNGYEFMKVGDFQQMGKKPTAQGEVATGLNFGDHVAEEDAKLRKKKT